MSRKRAILKTISAAVAAIFLVQQVAWAGGDTPAEAMKTFSRQNGAEKAAVTLGNIRVPSEIAQVDAVSEGNGELVVNIQDSHSSLSAQYSIVKILDELMKNYNLELVSIEGASGYIDTSILSSHPDKAAKEKTAAYLMKEGKISAGEFFSVMTSGDIALYGAEDNGLYRENVRCFREIYATNRANIAVLNSLLENLRRAEDRIYSKSLSTLVYKSRLHRDSKIGFDVYWSFLGDMCRDNGISTDGYKDIKSYEDSVKLEKDIDFKEATKERGALLDRLMKSASKEELEEMVVKSLAFEKGKIDQYDFHRWVLDIAVAKGMDPREYPELAKYGDYVTNYRSLDVAGLQKDLDEAEARLLDKLFTSGKARRLYRLVKTAELLKSLFEIRLMNGEVAFVGESLANLSADDFSEFLDTSAPAGMEKKLETVLSEAARAMKFYEVAEARNKVMLANTVSSMRREGKKVAALISGGHHSSGLTDLMKEKGLSYLVLMPKFSDDNSRPYVAILTKKAGPYREAAEKGGYDLALEAYFDTGNINELEEMIAFVVAQSVLEGKDAKAESKRWAASYREAYGNIPEKRREAMVSEPVTPDTFEKKLGSVVAERLADGSCEVNISGTVYTVSGDSLEVERVPAEKVPAERYAAAERLGRLALSLIPIFMLTSCAAADKVTGGRPEILVGLGILAAFAIPVLIIAIKAKIARAREARAAVKKKAVKPAATGVKTEENIFDESLPKEILDLARKALKRKAGSEVAESERDPWQGKKVKLSVVPLSVPGQPLMTEDEVRQFYLEGEEKQGTMTKVYAVKEVLCEAMSMLSEEHRAALGEKGTAFGDELEKALWKEIYGITTDPASRIEFVFDPNNNKLVGNGFGTPDWEFMVGEGTGGKETGAIKVNVEGCLGLTADEMAVALVHEAVHATRGQIEYTENEKPRLNGMLNFLNEDTAASLAMGGTYEPLRALLSTARAAGHLATMKVHVANKIRQEMEAYAMQFRFMSRLGRAHGYGDVRDYMRALAAASNDPARKHDYEVYAKYVDEEGNLREDFSKFVYSCSFGKLEQIVLQFAAVLEGAWNDELFHGWLMALVDGEKPAGRPLTDTSADKKGETEYLRYVTGAGYLISAASAVETARTLSEAKAAMPALICVVNNILRYPSDSGYSAGDLLQDCHTFARVMTPGENMNDMTRVDAIIETIERVVKKVKSLEGGEELLALKADRLVYAGGFALERRIKQDIAREIKAAIRDAGSLKGASAAKPQPFRIDPVTAELAAEARARVNDRNAPYDKRSHWIDMKPFMEITPSRMFASSRTQQREAEAQYVSGARGEEALTKVYAATEVVSRGLSILNDMMADRVFDGDEEFLGQMVAAIHGPALKFVFVYDANAAEAGNPKWQMASGEGPGTPESGEIKVNVDGICGLSAEEAAINLAHELVHVKESQRAYREAVKPELEKAMKFMNEMNALPMAMMGNFKTLQLLLSTQQAAPHVRVLKMHLARKAKNEMEAYEKQFRFMACLGAKRGFKDVRDYMKHLAAVTKDPASKKDYEAYVNFVDADGRIKEEFRIIALQITSGRSELAALQLIAANEGVMNAEGYKTWLNKLLTDPKYLEGAPIPSKAIKGGHPFLPAAAWYWGWISLASGVALNFFAFVAVGICGMAVLPLTTLAAGVYLLYAAYNFFMLAADVSKAVPSEKPLTRRKADGNIIYHGSFAFLKPTTRESMLLHESIASHFLGMLALMPGIYSVMKVVMGVDLAKADAEYERQIRDRLVYGLSDVWEVTTVKGGELSDEETKEVAKVLMMHMPEFAGMHIVIDASEKARKSVISTTVGFDEASRTVTVTPPYFSFNARGAEEIDLGKLADHVNRVKLDIETSDHADTSLESAAVKDNVLAWMDASMERMKGSALLRDMISRLKEEYAAEKGLVYNTDSRPMDPLVSAKRGVFYIIADDLVTGSPLSIAVNYKDLALMSDAEKDSVFLHEAAHLTDRGKEITLRLKKAERLVRAYPWNPEYLKMFLALAVESELDPELVRLWYFKNVVMRMPQSLLENYLSGLSPAKRVQVLLGIAGSMDMNVQEMAEVTYREVIKHQGRFLGNINTPDLNDLEGKEGLRWLTDPSYTVPYGEGDISSVVVHGFNRRSADMWKTGLMLLGGAFIVTGASFATFSLLVRADHAVYIFGAILAAGVYLGLSGFRYGRLAEAVYQALSERGFFDAEIDDAQIASRMMDGTIVIKKGFERLPPAAKRMILFHEMFKNHYIGMLILMPGPYGIYSFFRRHILSDVMMVRPLLGQSNFVNLAALVEKLEERAGGRPAEDPWREVPVPGVSPVIKQYLPEAGTTIVPRRRDRQVTRLSIAGSRDDEIRNWRFSVERKPNLPLHVDVTSTVKAMQGTMHRQYYRDVLEILSNISDQKVLWTNERSAIKGQNLHFHLFEFKQPLPVETFELEHLFRTRRGAPVVSKVKAYPNAKNPIAVYVVRSNVFDSDGRNLLASRMFDIEKIIRSNGFAVDKVFTEGKDGEMIVYLFPRVAGYAKYFPSDKEPRLVGPLAMSGRWILDNEEEFGTFSPDNIRGIFLKTAVSGGSSFAAKLDVEIKRNFEEAEGTGLLPPAVTYRPFDGRDVGSDDAAVTADFVNRQKTIIDRMWRSGVRRLNYTLDLSDSGVNNTERWNATSELLEHAKKSGMTTVLCLKDLVEKIDSLSDKWDLVRSKILPHVDKISFEVNEVSPRLDTAIGVFKQYCSTKSMEIYTSVSDSNKFVVTAIGEHLRKELKEYLNNVEWEVARGKGPNGKYLLKTEEYENLARMLDAEFANMPLDMALYSRTETEMYVTGEGLVTSPAVAVKGWSCDISDEAKLSAPENREVFKVVTDNIRKQSTYTPRSGKSDEKTEPGIDDAESLIPKIKTLCDLDLSNHVEAEEALAVSIARSMGLSDKAIGVMKLAVWAHHLGENPRVNFRKDYENMRSLLIKNYPDATAGNKVWHVHTAVQALLKDKGVSQDTGERRFEVFTREMAAMAERERIKEQMEKDSRSKEEIEAALANDKKIGEAVLTEQQLEVAASMFDVKAHSLNILSRNRMRLPREASILMSYYGEYGRFRKLMEEDPAYFDIFITDPALRKDMESAVAVIRIARMLANKNDQEFQKMRGEGVASLPVCIKFMIDNLQANDEYDKTTSSALLELMRLVTVDDQTVRKALNSLRMEHKASLLPEDTAFIRFLRNTPASVVEDPVEAMRLFGEYNLGPTVRDFRSFSSALLWTGTVVAAAGIFAMKTADIYYVLLGAVGFIAAAYLFYSAYQYRAVGNDVLAAITKSKNAAGKDPMETPAVKILPDGSLDRVDKLTLEVLENMRKDAPESRGYLDFFEYFGTKRGALFAAMPMVQGLFFPAQQLTQGHNRRSEKNVVRMLAVTAYGSLKLNKMQDRRGEMDFTGGEWQWKDGDGIALIATVGPELRREIEKLQGRLREIVGDPEKLQLTRPEDLHMTIAEIMKNTNVPDRSPAKVGERQEKKMMARTVALAEKAETLRVSFSLSRLTIRPDGSIMLLGRANSPVVEQVRAKLALALPDGDTMRKDILHITVGRMFDHQLSPVDYNKLREQVHKYQRAKERFIPMVPEIYIWDQAASGQKEKYVPVKAEVIPAVLAQATPAVPAELPAHPLSGKRPTFSPAEGKEEPRRDLAGTNAAESDELLKELIKEGRIVEVSIENDRLTARRVKWMDNYEAGKASSARYLGEEVDITKIFSKDQLDNMYEWMESHIMTDADDLEQKRGNVRFRMALGNAALGWGTSADHYNISHAGHRDGVIYIGELLLGKLFETKRNSVRDEILDKDEWLHLMDPNYDDRLDPEYPQRFLTAVNFIGTISSEPSGRYGIHRCKDDAEAEKRHKGEDTYVGKSIRWGNFTTAGKDDKLYEVNDMAAVPVSTSLYIDNRLIKEDLKISPDDPEGLAPQDVLKMKLWSGQRDNFSRWSDKRMQLVYTEPLANGTVYHFSGDVPAFFHGDFTFRYSVDGGKTWRWANYGVSDNRTISRKMLDVAEEHGAYGRWQGGISGPAYKRAKVIMLYKGNTNLKALVSKARPVEDSFWQDEWGNDDPSVFKGHKVISAGAEEKDMVLDVSDENGGKEGRILITYDEKANTIVIRMRSVSADELIPEGGRTYGDLGWYRATIEIPLDELGNAKEIIHKRGIMGISRSGMALLFKHAKFDEGDFAGLYGLLQRELVLYPVSSKMNLASMDSTEPLDIGRMAEIMKGAEDVTPEDAGKLKQIIETARSRSLTRLALICLETLAEKGKFRKDEYREQERMAVEKMVLEGMAAVERQIRQDKSLLRSMGIDRANVKNVIIRWFTSDVNKSIYRVTFRMNDGTAKVFAIEFMNPIFMGRNFASTNVTSAVNLWMKMSDKGGDFVPHVFLKRELGDFKPKILASPLPEAQERATTEFSIASAVVDPRNVIYDDTLLIARDFVEGQELMDYRAYAGINPDEEGRIYRAGLTAYFKMWKSLKDEDSGRGVCLLDPTKRNVVAYRDPTKKTGVGLLVGQEYHGVVSEMESLRHGISLSRLIYLLHTAGYGKEDILTAAKGVLNDDEYKLVSENYEKLVTKGGQDVLMEEHPFMMNTSDVPEEKLRAVAGSIIEKVTGEPVGAVSPAGAPIIDLTREQKSAAIFNIMGALSAIGEKINRDTEVPVDIKDRFNLAIEQMRRSEIWSKVKFYKARYAHGFEAGAATLPVFDMMYAFKKEGTLYLAEGFLDNTSMAKEEVLSAVLMDYMARDILAGMEPQKATEIVTKILGAGVVKSTTEAINKYAAKSYIKCVLEDDVLGIGPHKDLVTYQSLGESQEAVREAHKNAEAYLETVYQKTIGGISDVTFGARSELAAYLVRNFGVRKFIIAGGKGTRFSPDGIVVKQLFMPDNQSTNIKLSRISAAFGKLEDIVVVDTVTLFNVIKSDVDITEGMRNKVLLGVARQINRLVEEGAITTAEGASLLGAVKPRIKTELRYTRRRDGLMDLAMLTRTLNSEVKSALKLQDLDGRVQFLSDKLSYAIFKSVMAEGGIIDENKKDSLFGKKSIVILDSGDGHGSAYMEALKELEGKGELSRAKYSVIVHADSPGWGLGGYQNAVFVTYLKTVNMFSPQSGEAVDLPKVTIAVKNPQDGRAKGRARIFVEKAGKSGAISAVPVGLKEWNIMSEKEQRESEAMAAAKDPDWLTNANILICDTAWSASKEKVLREDYRHLLGKESKKKRRAYEYWSSDFLNIAAREYDLRKAQDPSVSPETRLVYLGQNAPNANKTLQHTLHYRDELQKMLLKKISDLGVEIVDRYATVSISGNDIGAEFDWDKAVKDIFGDNLNIHTGDKKYGNIKLRGAIHLDTTVRIGRGAILDGTEKDVWLTGNTSVARGVQLKGTVAHNRAIESDQLYEKETMLTSGIRTRPKLVRGVDFSGMGIVTDESTKIKLIKHDKSKSDEEIIRKIFGSTVSDGKVLDQIFLYGDIIVEESASVENGTMLDGRAGAVTLLGSTQVRKGTVLKSVEAKNTVFASRRGLDIYYYKQPTTIRENVWLANSAFENAYVEWSAVVQNSVVIDSCVMAGAKVLDSDIKNDIVTPDAAVEGRTSDVQEGILLAAVMPDPGGGVRYVPGATRLDENGEADRAEIKKYQFDMARKLYRMFLDDKEDKLILQRMDEDTERFLASSASNSLTLQQVREYFFSKVRDNFRKYKGTIPHLKHLDKITAGAREYVAGYMKRAEEIDTRKDDNAGDRELFRQVALLSARFNLVDPSLDAKLFDVLHMAQGIKGGDMGRKLEENTEARPAINGMHDFEELVFGQGPGVFVFLTDNMGEAEADAVMWELLVKLGHKVVIAPKEGFAFGDINVEGVMEIINSYTAPGGLKEELEHGRIEVIPSGSRGEGIMLHRMSPEMCRAMASPTLRAVISKGQANLFTVSTRNRVNVPVVSLSLSKSRTSANITGITPRKGAKFWPIIAVIPKGTPIRTPISRESFTGTMKRFGIVDSDAENPSTGHAMTSADAAKWAAYSFYSAAVFTALFTLATIIFWNHMPLPALLAGAGLTAFSVVSGVRFYLLSRLIYKAMYGYIFKGRSPDDVMKLDKISEDMAMNTPIARRMANDIVRYHPAFRDLDSTFKLLGRTVISPHRAQELIRMHESFRKHTLGMVAIIPALGLLVRTLYGKLMAYEDERRFTIHSDYSNMDTIIEMQLSDNTKNGFIVKELVGGERESGIEGEPRLRKVYDRSGFSGNFAKALDDASRKACNFCERNAFFSEAPRARTEDWAFSVDPMPVFTRQIVAIRANHVPQDSSDPEYYYDVLRMVSSFKKGSHPNDPSVGMRWQVSWPGRLGTTRPDHMHVVMFQRPEDAPVELYDQEQVSSDKNGQPIVYAVKDYPDREHAVAAFMIKGRADENLNIFAKRCYDLENVVRGAGYDVDKFITKDNRGVIKVFFYPRTGRLEWSSYKGVAKMLGPVQMSGIWTASSREFERHLGLKDVHRALRDGALQYYTTAYEKLASSVERHFYESEGKGIFPPSMDLMVTERCNLNCPICWGSYLPMHRIFSPEDKLLGYVDFAKREVGYLPTYETLAVKSVPRVSDGSMRKEPLDEASPLGKRLAEVRDRLSVYFDAEKGRGRINYVGFDPSNFGLIIGFEGSPNKVVMTPADQAYSDAVLALQKKMIDIMYDNGMRRMVFTGGEPLLERNLPALLEYAKKKGVTTWLFTNGLLLDRQKAMEIMPNVDMISLSLDGYDEETNSLNRKPGHYTAVMKVLDIMRKDYPDKDVQILTVVTNRNYDYIWNIGALLKEEAKGLGRFQWKLNYYKRIGRSQVETKRSEEDPFLMSYEDFKSLAGRVQQEYSDMRVRFSPPEHDNAYLFVFPDGTLATTVHAEYVLFGNVLDPAMLSNPGNRAVFQQITDNIRQRSIFILQKGAYSAPDFKKSNIMGESGQKIIAGLHEGLAPDIVRHIRRVTMLSESLSSRLSEKGVNIPLDWWHILRTAALLHDLGAQEKHDPRLKPALDRINKGIHAPGKERVEPTGISIYEWARKGALANMDIPREELKAAIAVARQEGDYYPLYRLYIKYVALEKAPGGDLAADEEMVTRNLFSHGHRSVEMLRDKGIEFPAEVELLIDYHHDYNALDERLKELVSEGRMDQEKADMIRLLETVLITADVLEMGNNYDRRVRSGKGGKIEDFAQTLDPVNGFLWKRFNQMERIPDRRVMEALRDLLGGINNVYPMGIRKVDPVFASIIADSRGKAESDSWMLPEDDYMVNRICRLKVSNTLNDLRGERKNLDIIVGLPSGIYDRLSRSDLEALKDTPGSEWVAIVRIDDAGTPEEQVQQLSETTRGVAGISALISSDAVSKTATSGEIVKELLPVIDDFTRKVKQDMFRMVDPSEGELKEEDVQKITSLSEISHIMTVLMRAIPDCRSYMMKDKSIRQMRVEKSYYEYYGKKSTQSGRVEYQPEVLGDSKAHFLVHFADGKDFLARKGPMIIPPGLEIQKRREAQKVDQNLDPYRDKFYVVAPEKNMSPEQIGMFKKKVMDLWMLEGVVSEEDVVILGRKDEKYKAVEIYGLAKDEFRDGITSRNSGIRVLCGELDYDADFVGEGAVLLEMDPRSTSTVNQYEVFINLIISKEIGALNYEPSGLEKVLYTHYRYRLKAEPIDLEREVSGYYDRYVREVAIKA